MQRYLIVETEKDGHQTTYPMKKWLRLHPEMVPDGFDIASSTSHTACRALVKAGWRKQETPTEVYLTMPGAVMPIQDDIYSKQAPINTSEECIPPCPELLPEDMRKLIYSLGKMWANSEACPKIKLSTKEAWETLIHAWANDDALPLLIRKGSEVRGGEIQHVSGRILVPVDNSPAQWACGLALSNIIPTIKDIKKLLEDDRLPVSFAHKKDEKDKRKYHYTLGSHSINKDGWKLCHIVPVGQNARDPLPKIHIERLKKSFIDLMSPSNFVLVPLEWGGLGEVKEFLDGVTLKEFQHNQEVPSEQVNYSEAVLEPVNGQSMTRLGGLFRKLFHSK